MIRGGRVKTCPACVTTSSAALWIPQGVSGRMQGRSKYGAKRPKAGKK